MLGEREERPGEFRAACVQGRAACVLGKCSPRVGCVPSLTASYTLEERGRGLHIIVIGVVFETRVTSELGTRSRRDGVLLASLMLTLHKLAAFEEGTSVRKCSNRRVGSVGKPMVPFLDW